MLEKTHSPLFREIPLPFFRPLAGKLAPLYWASLCTLYHLDFDSEPLELTRETALEQISLLIEQHPDFASRTKELAEELQKETVENPDSAESASPSSPEDEPENEPKNEKEESEREARSLARLLLKRLEKCGWFDYEYQKSKKGFVLNLRDYAARILQTLTQVASQEQPVFEGLAYRIKASLSDESLGEKPGAALYNAQNATRELVREIKILSRNIHRYAETALKEAATPKELLALQLDIYQHKVVDSTYHRFKTSDNIFKYRKFIIDQLNRFEEEIELQGAAVQWIARNRNKDYGAAHAEMEEWTSFIQRQMSSIQTLTDELDRKNARYTATTAQKITYLLNQSHLLQVRLQGLLKHLAELPDEVTPSFSPALPCFKIETLDAASLYVTPKERAPLEFTPLEIPTMAPEKKAALLEKARKSVENHYTKKQIYRLAQSLLKHRSLPLPLQELPWQSESDFLNAIFLIYHATDRRAPFDLSTVEGLDASKILLESGRFRFRPLSLHWKGENFS